MAGGCLVSGSVAGESVVGGFIKPLRNILKILNETAICAEFPKPFIFLNFLNF